MRDSYNDKSDAGCKGNRQTGIHFHLSNIIIIILRLQCIILLYMYIIIYTNVITIQAMTLRTSGGSTLRAVP